MFTIIVGTVLPYIAVVAFVGGIFYRLSVWKKAPQPGKLTLYPSKGWRFTSALIEAVLFPSIYKSDKLFWVLAWSFHAALVLAFLGHFRVVTSLVDTTLFTFGLSIEGINLLSAVGGGIAGIALIISISAIFLRRTFLTRVREISGIPDFFALFLLVAVIATGNFMRFHAGNIDLSETRTWAFSLLSFSPVAPAHPAVLAHAFAAELLFLYIAFSKLMHFGGFFFTFPIVRRG